MGSKSADDFKWRSSLKAGDNIDCWDTTGFWYASTVLQIQQREYQGTKLEMAYIGYRVNHPDGDKTDDDGNKFFGWEDKYDDWVPVFSACLHPYNSHTDGTFKDQTSAAQNSQNTYLAKKAELKDKVDDSQDMTCTEQRGQLIYAVERSSCRSEMLTGFINAFGRLGGFDMMLKTVQDENQHQNGLVLVSAYLECLARSAPMYHRKFVDTYFKTFIDALQTKMISSSPQQLRVAKKERFDDMVENIYKKLLPRLGAINVLLANDQKLLF